MKLRGVQKSNCKNQARWCPVLRRGGGCQHSLLILCLSLCLSLLSGMHLKVTSSSAAVVAAQTLVHITFPPIASRLSILHIKQRRGTKNHGVPQAASTKLSISRRAFRTGARKTLFRPDCLSLQILRQHRQGRSGIQLPALPWLLLPSTGAQPATACVLIFSTLSIGNLLSPLPLTFTLARVFLRTELRKYNMGWCLVRLCHAAESLQQLLHAFFTFSLGRR